MATGTTKMLLPEHFGDSNDIENFVTHLKLLAHLHLQKWRRIERRDQNEIVTDDSLTISFNFGSKFQPFSSTVH